VFADCMLSWAFYSVLHIPDGHDAISTLVRIGMFSGATIFRRSVLLVFLSCCVSLGHQDDSLPTYCPPTVSVRYSMIG
jgi:hypothetical protein